MNWENLTSKNFEKAVNETKTCIIAFGVLEKHSEHLPLGTDYLNGHEIVSRAAEIEKAVVFPPFYFGQIYEARCFPGTLTLKPTLLIEVIQSVLDEIGRNGFKKIIFYNAHGGNTFLLQFLAQSQLYEEKPYQVYMYLGDNSPKVKEAFNTICDSKFHGHACECETSISLFNHQDIVKMEDIKNEPATPLRRLAHVPNNFSGLSWYSNYPDHYAGDARTATYEKGKALVELEVESFVNYIKAVKNDTVLPQLSDEFFTRVNNIKNL
ncbi:MAG: creatininase family protein [Haloplasmataceae bacterium]|jgi:creatinine amidohydrolase|nr:creatininase family protein [Haloplasmataceae bacterium]